jgi:hypothetical protein
MKIFIIITLLLISIPISKSTNAQTLKLGFRIEPTVLMTEVQKENSISITPFSFYLNVLVEPIEWLNLEVRQGYLLGEEYSGFELGAFARIKIFSTKFYIVTGLINHSNNPTAHNSGGSYEKEMLYKGVGIGFQKDSKLSFDLMYYWTDNKDFRYSRQTDFLTYSKIVNTRMNAVIKLGFSLAWDIF